MPKLSIITPCYNAERFIEDNIQSVNVQTWQDWERIFVNDGSTDQTASLIARAIEGDPRQRLANITNHGVSYARNFGFSLSSRDTQYILFLDADDLYHPSLLEEMVNVLDKNPDAGVVFSDNYFIDEHGNRCGSMEGPRLIPTRWWLKEIPDEIPATPFVSLYSWTKIGEGMTMLRRQAFERAGGWSPDLYYGEGIYLYSHISLFSTVIYLNKKLCYYRRHPGQVTHNLSTHHVESDKIEEKLRELIRTRYPQWLEMANQAAIFKNHRIPATRQYKLVIQQLKEGRLISALKLSRHALFNFVKSLKTDYRLLRGGI